MYTYICVTKQNKKMKKCGCFDGWMGGRNLVAGRIPGWALLLPRGFISSFLISFLFILFYFILLKSFLRDHVGLRWASGGHFEKAPQGNITYSLPFITSVIYFVVLRFLLDEVDGSGPSGGLMSLFSFDLIFYFCVFVFFVLLYRVLVLKIAWRRLKC